VPVRVRIDDGEISVEEAGKYLRPDLSATVSFLRADATANPEPPGSSRRSGQRGQAPPLQSTDPRPEAKK
jgi:hypothetical protein